MRLPFPPGTQDRLRKGDENHLARRTTKTGEPSQQTGLRMLRYPLCPSSRSRMALKRVGVSRLPLKTGLQLPLHRTGVILVLTGPKSYKSKHEKCISL
ncbi:hypothetical protein D9C73_002946 [Collichthys lucidus]|uniref:Uncharacterized protein n=1 Tax=Collichthys lucidus TaxID=240159 RepID=A0A4U5U3Z0_COLLU|nr:hypothetical protein D9C73_002946 [Collichthys lucidus]